MDANCPKLSEEGPLGIRSHVHSRRLGLRRRPAGLFRTRMSHRSLVEFRFFSLSLCFIFSISLSPPIPFANCGKSFSACQHREEYPRQPARSPSTERTRIQPGYLRTLLVSQNGSVLEPGPTRRRVMFGEVSKGKPLTLISRFQYLRSRLVPDWRSPTIPADPSTREVLVSFVIRTDFSRRLLRQPAFRLPPSNRGGGHCKKPTTLRKLPPKAGQDLHSPPPLRPERWRLGVAVARP